MLIKGVSFQSERLRCQCGNRGARAQVPSKRTNELACELFQSGFEAGGVGDVQHLCIRSDSTHESAQGFSRAELNEPCEALRKQIPHGILPANRSSHLFHYPTVGLLRGAMGLACDVGNDGNRWNTER